MAKKIGKFVFPHSDNQREDIRDAFKQLGLTECADAFMHTIDETQKANGTMYDVLQEILRQEFEHQEEARVNRWVQQSKLLQIKRIDSSDEKTRFDFAKQPVINHAQIRELVSCRFVEDGKNIIFLGPNGVGKTHLALALGYEAILKAHETRCMTLNEFTDTVDSNSPDALKRLHRSLLRPKLLILDDIDYFTADVQAGEFLFQILLNRYNRNLSTIVTANKNPSEWDSLFGSKEHTTKILDRLFDHRRAIIVNIMGGVSQRVPNSLTETLAQREADSAPSKLRNFLGSATKNIAHKEA